MKELFERQREFQKLCNVDIDTNRESERNRIGEIYLAKAIEEIVETRKEFPSNLNPDSKNQKFADVTRIKEELSDVLLFLVNFCLIWKFSPEEVFETVLKVQSNNFDLKKRRMMESLNTEILSIPSYVSGIGQGHLTPKYIFIGQNPGKDITHGYKFWSDQSDGSSKVLLPILEELGILDDCYFTNIVKCTTLNNVSPSEDLTKFWMEYLNRELDILNINNPTAKVITLGKWAGLQLPFKNITHPASVLYGGIDKEQYEEELKKAIAPHN